MTGYQSAIQKGQDIGKPSALVDLGPPRSDGGFPRVKADRESGWGRQRSLWAVEPRAQRFSIGMHLNTTNAFLPQKTIRVKQKTITMIIPAHSEQKATRGSWPYY